MKIFSLISYTCKPIGQNSQGTQFNAASEPLASLKMFTTFPYMSHIKSTTNAYHYRELSGKINIDVDPSANTIQLDNSKACSP